MKYVFAHLGTADFGFAQPHLALILRNSSVWDMKFDNQFRTISKEKLIQLPPLSGHGKQGKPDWKT